MYKQITVPIKGLPVQVIAAEFANPLHGTVIGNTGPMIAVETVYRRKQDRRKVSQVFHVPAEQVIFPNLQLLA